MRYTVYSDRGLRKPANIPIGETGTSELVAFLLKKRT